MLKCPPTEAPDFDQVFHALADPSRRTMVQRLARGPASVSQLAAPFEMSLAAVMQHLRVLEAAAIVSSVKIGRVRTCRLEPAVLRSSEEWMGNQRSAWEARLDRLGDELGRG
jgi:DNA-binding transcriptional ArsR family regulator